MSAGDDVRVRMLRENARKFRALARTDRPQRDMWMRRARSCDARIREITG